MPRVKPMEITPGSASVGHLGGRRRARRGEGGAAGDRRLPPRPEAVRALGARVPKGILFHGPPGTGKTLAAKAVAHESGARFYAQSASAFVEMFAGLGAARIRKLFEEARKNAPSIVFIDELDAVGQARSGHAFNREQDQTLNQLLVELDGFGPRDQVVVMGASNRLQDLDHGAAAPRPLRPADPRSSRPTSRAARRSSRVHTRGKPLADDVDLDGDRAPDRRPDRRRPREHLQRGGDRRRPPRQPRARAGGLRLRARARRRGPAAAPRRSPTRRSGSSPTTRAATRSCRT